MKLLSEFEIIAMGGLCPFQAEGLIDGHPFYFRSRGDAWSFTVLKEKTAWLDYVAWAERDSFYYEEDYGVWPDAGYITKAEAISFMNKGAKLFLNNLK